ncbi:MAG: ankyrin repeat domain-containing protein [Candidatus Xenobia bacterium]
MPSIRQVSTAAFCGLCFLFGVSCTRRPAPAAKSPKGKAVFDWAVRTGNADELRQILGEHPEFARLLVDGEPPLVAALSSNGAGLLEADATVQVLIDKGADIKAAASTGTTPLDLAVEYGQNLLAARLLKAGADVNSQDSQGFSPLMYATTYKNTAGLALLLDAKADPNLLNKARSSALNRALQSNDVAAAVLLLKAGAHPTTDADGTTSLHYAVLSRSTQILGVIRKLLAFKVDVNARRSGGVTPIYWAASSGLPQTVALLLSSGAHLEDAQDDSPLIAAVRNGNVATFNLLMDRGANPHVKDKILGESLLHMAASDGHVEVVARLLAVRLDVNACANDKSTPLHAAAGYTVLLPFLAKGEVPPGEREHLAVVDKLLAAGARVVAEDYRGLTPLGSAAEAGHDQILRRLAEVPGANLRQTTKLREGLLSLLVSMTERRLIEGLEERGHLDMKAVDAWLASRVAERKASLEFLLSKGLPIDQVDGLGRTPLMVAAESGDPEFLKVLVAHGAKLTATDAERRTLLHYAARGGNLEVLRYLLAQGLDRNAKDAQGKGPADDLDRLDPTRKKQVAELLRRT